MDKIVILPLWEREGCEKNQFVAQTGRTIGVKKL